MRFRTGYSPKFQEMRRTWSEGRSWPCGRYGVAAGCARVWRHL